MPNTIYLPESEDLEVLIKIGKTDEVKVDIYELEEWFVEANDISKEMQTEWREEFPKVFMDKTGKTISQAQSKILWQGVSIRIQQVKKNLLVESSPSSKPESRSRRKAKKK